MVAPAYTEISHFHAPYKDAMFAGVGGLSTARLADDAASSGYGVYEGVGEDDDFVIDERLRGMWGSNPWNGVGADPGGTRRHRSHPKGSRRAAHGIGADAPTPLAAGTEPAIATLDPFFQVVNGITVATDATATSLDQILQTWGQVDPAFAAQLGTLGDTVGVVFYHGTNTPPPGAEPGPYQPLVNVLMQYMPKAGEHMVVLSDKRLLVPQAGKRQIVLTKNPQVVADNAGVGGSYFLTKDADALIVAAAQELTRKKAGIATQAGAFLKSPAGIGLVAVAGMGAIYLMTRGGKKRRAA